VRSFDMSEVSTAMHAGILRPKDPDSKGYINKLHSLQKRIRSGKISSRPPYP
jgi:hypothetical protein